MYIRVCIGPHGGMCVYRAVWVSIGVCRCVWGTWVAVVCIDIYRGGWGVCRAYRGRWVSIEMQRGMWVSIGLYQ